ncbi:hypothetical protein PM082_003299 [Marasmius tenuissimus]|nr:hypothetical protein PM082_003299 [Marasmius tenuissimus]
MVLEGQPQETFVFFPPLTQTIVKLFADSAGRMRTAKATTCKPRSTEGCNDNRCLFLAVSLVPRILQ